MVIDQRTAKAIGLVVPESFLTPISLRAFVRASAKVVMRMAATSPSNFVGPKVKVAGCRHWPPTSRAGGCH